MRICGNSKCKNYGETWDLKHHSMCPFCPKEIKPTLIKERILLEVKADGTTTDGIPSKTKVLGILPNEL